MAWQKQQLKWKPQNSAKLKGPAMQQYSKAVKALELAAAEVASFRKLAEPLFDGKTFLAPPEGMVVRIALTVSRKADGSYQPRFSAAAAVPSEQREDSEGWD